MSVLIETTLGDLVVDLFVKERPNTCKNFLKLCKVKYYNLNQIFTIQVSKYFIFKLLFFRQIILLKQAILQIVDAGANQLMGKIK